MLDVHRCAVRPAGLQWHNRLFRPPELRPVRRVHGTRAETGALISNVFTRMHLFLLPSTAIALTAATLASTSIALAAPVKTGHVTAELVAEQTALVPGATTTVALRLAIEPGWHTYWRNPGESGLPTTLAWRLPPGYGAGDIVWPAPRALPAGPLMNYGYEGDVLHLVPLRVPADVQDGSTATLAARADWLVCRETCIPEGADLTLVLPVGERAAPDSRWQPAFAAARDALPKPLPAGWSASAAASGAFITLQLAPERAGNPGRIQFFAEQESRIEPSAPQTVTKSHGRIEVKLPVAHDLSPGYKRLQGVVTAERGFGDGGAVRAIALDVPIDGTPMAGPKPVAAAATSDFTSTATGASLSLPLALAFALTGGLLLNLMPCVFPVLSLKALGLAASATHDRQSSRREGIAFGVGVIVAFALLGAAIATLRAAGEQLGWGFQLQSPAVVTALTLLFFVMALNLSGMFEFGSLVPSRLASWSHANRNANAFASGLLAVAIASPCTAPFMGAALGYALAEKAHVTLGVFVALGVGMSLPYVALAWFPAWRRVLPRPGPWMVRLRQLLAFPLYATVAWLVWVLGAQVGNDAVIRIGAALVLAAFALWAWRGWQGGGRIAWATVAVLGALASAVVAWPLFAREAAGETTVDARVARNAAADGWEPYSARRVAELTSAGRPVFVDFTAAWCITCQVNKRLVLSDARVRAAFARADVALLRADWTRRDPAITQALTALGRTGVPVYVLYRAGGEPVLLPEVLQRDRLIDAIAAS
jgi:thiol:disulfide interchange protein DsbD